MLHDIRGQPYTFRHIKVKKKNCLFLTSYYNVWNNKKNESKTIIIGKKECLLDLKSQL